MATTTMTATTTSTKFPVVQTKPIPTGSPGYEQKRADLLKTFYDKIPAEYLLPREIIDNPPTNVTDIPRTCGILTADELAITVDYDAFSLAEAIASRKLTSVDVATAFCKRAIIAHQLTCCLTQWFMDTALEQARKLDEYLATHGKTIGPLHGVPISIKEHMPIAGTFSSGGYFGSIKKDDQDCHMMRILREAGAVFYVKTNQPQTIMHLESDSHWGRVLNPYNIHLSAGGSTGGEAALIAMKGSALGVGTDIGGSVRGPSAFCGVYGFKSTSYYLPQEGFLATPFPAELNVLCSTGPMCRSLRDMDFFMNVVLATKPFRLDPRLVPIPWTGLSSPAKRPLKFGLMFNDGVIQPQPPVQKAMEWARSQLSDPKHADIVQVKKFRPFDPAQAWSKIRRMYWPDGGAAAKDGIEAAGEPVHPLSEWIWKDAVPFGHVTATDVSTMRGERDKYRLEFAKDWAAQDVDVVIGPAFVGPACAHDTAFYWNYTSLFNFVDYPGVVFPTPIKSSSSDRYDTGYTPLSDNCKHVKQLWEEGNFDEAPIGLQVIAPKYHDNELFGALLQLKELLNLP